MRRLAAQSVACVGALIALAVFDFGPRAAAAYQPVAGARVPARLGLDVVAGTDAAPAVPPGKPPGGQGPDDKSLYGVQQPASGGSMASHSPAGGGGNTPVGWLPGIELPPANLVVYYREPPGLLERSAFIDSILDPPRRA